MRADEVLPKYIGKDVIICFHRGSKVSRGRGVLSQALGMNDGMSCFLIDNDDGFFVMISGHYEAKIVDDKAGGTEFHIYAKMISDEEKNIIEDNREKRDEI